MGDKDPVFLDTLGEYNGYEVEILRYPDNRIRFQFALAHSPELSHTDILQLQHDADEWMKDQIEVLTEDR